MGGTAYSDRTDLEKLQSQWTKMNALRRREDWAAAVVRAATAAEIAANIAVRQRFAGVLSSAFIDSLLDWANGIRGKFQRLLIPSEADATRVRRLKQLDNPRPSAPIPRDISTSAALELTNPPGQRRVTPSSAQSPSP